MSAPAGGAYKLFPTTTDSGHNKVGKAVIEEEGPSSTAARSRRARDSDLPRVTIAIAGADNAGKTTFVASALDLKSPPASPATTKKMILEGSMYLVCLLEVPSEDVIVGDAGKIGWPRLGTDSVPSIDGVLVLHDPTQPATFDKTGRLLGTSSLAVRHSGDSINKPRRSTRFPPAVCRSCE